MPRARSLKNGQLSEAYNPATCSICNAVISNKTDLPRHMKIHSMDREKLMHRCPYPDCNFENLQKSNVETHIRTHTKSKTSCCPDCDFTTVDPGSLTRHRKRIHGYIPKMRRSRHPKPESEPGDTPGADVQSKPLTLRFSPYSVAQNQQTELSHNRDSQSSTSTSPPSIADMLNEALPDYSSRSPTQSQPPPHSRSSSPTAMAGPSYSFVLERQTSQFSQPRPPSPPIDPTLLNAGPPRAIGS
ncbi:hypothetical protein DFH05DRAFT_867244 [Lentinula detonsa]|uniref:C2H2-type domain-containing protein n=2 Tax=Lentinula TaxID=5352 RepID=A0AA38KZK6_9AGAR|nr:hypothetical protein DFH05DRAFT_867244 [Lentinula detonsa]KAJ3785783.1 hypothetical protein GGU10DRAFT_188395 [Lentinula aff. detonsa]